jgi:hypothetical protein
LGIVTTRSETAFSQSPETIYDFVTNPVNRTKTYPHRTDVGGLPDTLPLKVGDTWTESGPDAERIFTWHLAIATPRSRGSWQRKPSTVSFLEAITRLSPEQTTSVMFAARGAPAAAPLPEVRTGVDWSPTQGAVNRSLKHKRRCRSDRGALSKQRRKRSSCAASRDGQPGSVDGQLRVVVDRPFQHGHRVIERRRKRMLGRQPVADRDDRTPTRLANSTHWQWSVSRLPSMKAPEWQ